MTPKRWLRYAKSVIVAQSMSNSSTTPSPNTFAIIPPMKGVKSITVAELTAMAEAMYGSAEFVEFDSMVNIRPRQGNMSRDVEDAAIRSQITEIVNGIVKP